MVGGMGLERGNLRHASRLGIARISSKIRSRGGERVLFGVRCFFLGVFWFFLVDWQIDKGELTLYRLVVALSGRAPS